MPWDVFAGQEIWMNWARHPVSMRVPYSPTVSVGLTRKAAIALLQLDVLCGRVKAHSTGRPR